VQRGAHHHHVAAIGVPDLPLIRLGGFVSATHQHHSGSSLRLDVHATLPQTPRAVVQVRGGYHLVLTSGGGGGGLGI